MPIDGISGRHEVEVAIVGGGAAGIAAARTLASAGRDVLILEARARLGGRAWTIPSPVPLDLGCAWLHSGDRNPWVAVAEGLGFPVERRHAPWQTRRDINFPPEQRAAYQAAAEAFYDRLDEAAASGAPDRPAADLLEPGNRWNGLLDAISGYMNGVELAGLSVRDFANYADTGVNWRIPAGYGTAIAAAGQHVPVALGCAVTRIRHGATPIEIETALGTLKAKAVIVTLPTNVLAAETVAFYPPLPDKIEAASALPLGIADKVLLALDAPEDVPLDGHAFGSLTSARTASYHLRPFGRPMIEGYFGGALARDLEAGGTAAFTAFALDELAGILGSGIRAKLTPITSTAWARDPFALGSYSQARPGRADARLTLAAPVGDRLFFAGEACHVHDFSTAHGAYRTGVAAAEAALGTVLGPCLGAADKAAPVLLGNWPLRT
ncbi:flavin monoamine oxidase family protein [Segnochrobactrum spirostomi]|uniref:Tryptophan 2-monooxygenase n=1 Tax=Segnochrobactrum spirostomi TaxID=2608987 RepID=A0A6A7Y0J5_9HYPH|nr:NAD(P)/FAD-dependent oxidoreductase [Segnochrobactrum spirostomi]MQT11479.1 FAD-dependent oxidoreductase [Segnochrobactrum spirostomi]